MLKDFEVNPQFLQMVSPNETVVVVSLMHKIGETSGMINICIPHIVLEPIIPKYLLIIGCKQLQKNVSPEEIEMLEKGC